MYSYMTFRIFQALTGGGAFFYWFIRFLTNPTRLHPTMLMAAFAVLLVSELSYQAGKLEKDSRKESVRNKIS